MSMTQTVHHDIYDFIDPRKNLKGAAAGKSVLVTGGGKGIGRATAQQFAIAGATTIFVSSRTLPDLEETVNSVKPLNSDTRVIPIVADITKTSDVAALFATVKKELGDSAVDICVSNAGTSGVLFDIADSNVDEWWDSIEINLKGVYLVGREFIRAVRDAGKKEGVLINTTSVGSYWAFPKMSSYIVAKAAVNRFSELVDFEHRKDGIRSYAYHPGGVRTDWWRYWDSTMPGLSDQIGVDKPEMGGATCVYLSTPRAAWLSGKYVSANWDMEELEGMREKIEKEGFLIQKINGSNIG